MHTTHGTTKLAHAHTHTHTRTAIRYTHTDAETHKSLHEEKLSRHTLILLEKGSAILSYVMLKQGPVGFSAI